MDREAWWATAHGVTRARHDLATKPLPYLCISSHFTLNKNYTENDIWDAMDMNI